jgi:hypothetical protein
MKKRRNSMSIFYGTRSQDGIVTEYDSLEDAMKAFAGYDGYRLTLHLDDIEINIHRDELPLIDKISMAYVDSKTTNYNSYNSKVTISRKVKP